MPTGGQRRVRCAEAGITELQSLQVAFSYKAQLPADRIMLLANLVKLETLKINAQHILRGDFSFRPRDIEVPSFTQEHFEELLSRLEHLRRLHLGFAWSYPMHTILESAGRYKPPLESLNLGNQLDIDMTWLKRHPPPLFPRPIEVFEVRRFVDWNCDSVWDAR